MHADKPCRLLLFNWQARDLDAVRHLGLRLRQVMIVTNHHFLGQHEDILLQLEYITQRVAVLKAVQAPDLNVSHYVLTCGGLSQHRLQRRQQLQPLIFIELRLVLRRHVVGINRVDHLRDQRWLGHELLGGLDLVEIYLALDLLILAMALHATLGKQRLEKCLKLVSSRSGTGGCE